MFAGDYTWEMNFTGSTWLRPATVQDMIRIQGRANVTVTLGSDWTPRGTTNWVSGAEYKIGKKMRRVLNGIIPIQMGEVSMTASN